MILAQALFIFDAFGVGTLEFIYSLCPMVPMIAVPERDECE
jgi:hypothetical protein